MQPLGHHQNLRFRVDKLCRVWIHSACFSGHERAGAQAFVPSRNSSAPDHLSLTHLSLSGNMEPDNLQFIIEE